MAMLFLFFKSGDPAVVGGGTGNYRPISLVFLVSKVLERIVHNALMEHVLEFLTGNLVFGWGVLPKRRF